MYITFSHRHRSILARPITCIDLSIWVLRHKSEELHGSTTGQSGTSLKYAEHQTVEVWVAQSQWLTMTIQSIVELG